MTGDCDCCRAENLEVERHHIPGRGDPRREVSLCALCAGTLTGALDAYPEQNVEWLEIMRTICFVGNAVLAAIRETRP